MKTKIRKSQVVATIAVVLLLLSLTGSYYQYTSNQKLKGKMNQEKLHSEALLSEKLQLEKDILDFKNLIGSLEGENEGLDKVLASAKGTLEQKERELKALKKENAGVKDLKKELAEVKKMRTDMEGQVQELLATIDALQKENGELSATVAALKDENKLLAQSLEQRIADNFRVDALKGKKMKLTAAAKRANSIVSSFTLAPEAATDIKFKIVNPAGQTIEGEDKGITFNYIEDGNGLTASLNGTENLEVTKRIEMTYKPEEKLQPGIYKIELYKGESYLGSCQVRLR